MGSVRVCMSDAVLIKTLFIRVSWGWDGNTWWATFVPFGLKPNNLG